MVRPDGMKAARALSMALSGIGCPRYPNDLENNVSPLFFISVMLKNASCLVGIGAES